MSVCMRYGYGVYELYQLINGDDQSSALLETAMDELQLQRSQYTGGALHH